MTTNTNTYTNAAYQGGMDRDARTGYAIYAVFPGRRKDLKIASFPTYALMLSAWELCIYALDAPEMIWA